MRPEFYDRLISSAPVENPVFLRRPAVADTRVWLPGWPAPWTFEYLAALDGILAVRAISFSIADFPPDSPWARWAPLFVRPLADKLRWNIAISADAATRGRLYTEGQVNIAIVERVHPSEINELSRWVVWTPQPWGLVDHYVNTYYLPPDGHALANGLTAAQLASGLY